MAVNGRELAVKGKRMASGRSLPALGKCGKAVLGHLHVQDIFGDRVITTPWGGIGSRRGNLKHYPCNDLAQMKKHIRRIICRRLMYVHT